MDVALVTQCSVERIPLLEDLSKHWPGTISVALYLTDAEVQNFLEFVHGSVELRNRKNIAYHVVYKDGVRLIMIVYILCTCFCNKVYPVVTRCWVISLALGLMLISLKLREWLSLVYILMQTIGKHSKYIRIPFIYREKCTNGFWLNGNRCTVAFLSSAGVEKQSIYVHISFYIHILTSGAKSGARSSNGVESGVRMAGRFLEKKASLLLHALCWLNPMKCIYLMNAQDTPKMFYN